MNVQGSKGEERGMRHLLERPATCALYLTDALESKQPDVVAEALRDICRARGTGRNGLETDANLRVADLLEAVRSSGLRLVALPVR
jgi:DNA-binding phage protein